MSSYFCGHQFFFFFLRNSWPLIFAATKFFFFWETRGHLCSSVVVRHPEIKSCEWENYAIQRKTFFSRQICSYMCFSKKKLKKRFAVTCVSCFNNAQPRYKKFLFLWACIWILLLYKKSKYERLFLLSYFLHIH